MNKYWGLLQSLFLIVLLIACAKLYFSNARLKENRYSEIKRQRKISESIFFKKEKEIQRLKSIIKTESEMINESIKLFNELQQQKKDIETVYVEKVKIINNYDAKELKNYFDQELN